MSVCLTSLVGSSAGDVRTAYSLLAARVSSFGRIAVNFFSVAVGCGVVRVIRRVSSRAFFHLCYVRRRFFRKFLPAPLFRQR